MAAGSLVSALGFCTASAVKSFLTLTTSFGCPLNLTSHGISCSAGDCAVDGATQKQRTGSRNLPWNMADNSTPLDYCYSIRILVVTTFSLTHLGQCDESHELPRPNLQDPGDYIKLALLHMTFCHYRPGGSTSVWLGLISVLPVGSNALPQSIHSNA